MVGPGRPGVVGVTCTTDKLRVVLSDGRDVGVPLSWFPRLLNATEEQRRNWRIIGPGTGIHWEAIDEDIAVEDLLASE